jgi:hypothetical protein
MIPVLHNTLLATLKIKLFLGLLPIFGALQPTHRPKFLWAQTQYYSGEIVLLWSLPNSDFLQGFCTFLGPTWAFCVSGVTNQILFRGLYPSLQYRTLIWPLVFCPSLCHKFKFDFRGLLIRKYQIKGGRWMIENRFATLSQELVDNYSTVRRSLGDFPPKSPRNKIWSWSP